MEEKVRKKSVGIMEKYRIFNTKKYPNFTTFNSFSKELFFFSRFKFFSFSSINFI
uniref:Uncharacterized protein n=1 Tax=Meloidogyne enterolobii TaxID=390850 RepID=A0A6V7WW91_MELEN|nr:unnamed protein product [Meloidogyne enterolobii]